MGTWYPGSRAELEAAVDAYVATADFREVPQRRTAIVAPHAGLIYSGPAAAFAYAAVREVRYRAVVLVGPSHFVAFHGVSIRPSGAWDTPMGPVAVDEDLAEAIVAASPIVAVRASAHEREHSLEMQLPFLARRHARHPDCAARHGPSEQGDGGRISGAALPTRSPKKRKIVPESARRHVIA